MKYKILLLIAVCFLCFVFIIYRFFYCLQCLPEGDLINQFESPDKKHTINIYKVGGGATVAFSIRGELEYNEKDRKNKTIYWEYKNYNAELEWLDNETVKINNHELNIFNDTYDFRRD